MAAWEQATRDRMRIVSKAKNDAGDSADLWRRPRGFDALGLPIPVRRLGAQRLLSARPDVDDEVIMERAMRELRVVSPSRISLSVFEKASFGA